MVLLWAKDMWQWHTQLGKWYGARMKVLLFVLIEMCNTLKVEVVLCGSNECYAKDNRHGVTGKSFV